MASRAIGSAGDAVEVELGEAEGLVHAGHARARQARRRRVDAEQPDSVVRGGDEQDLGGVAVEHRGDRPVEDAVLPGDAHAGVGRAGDAGPGERGHGTLGNASQRFGMLGGEESRAGDDGYQQRGRCECPAELLEHDVGLGEGEAGAAVLLRDGQGGHAHLLAERRPQVGVEPGRLLDRLADRLAVRALVEQGAHGARQLGVLPGGHEVGHRASRRSVSSRSRWNAGRPPGRLQRTDAEQPQAQVVLLGVADRAVDLQADAGREVGCVGALDLRRRDRARRRVHRRAEDQRPREVERDAYVGQLMLDRLVRPDLPAELLALLGVGDGVGQHPLAGAEQLGGRRQRREVERCVEVYRSFLGRTRPGIDARRGGATRRPTSPGHPPWPFAARHRRRRTRRPRRRRRVRTDMRRHRHGGSTLREVLVGQRHRQICRRLDPRVRERRDVRSPRRRRTPRPARPRWRGR